MKKYSEYANYRRLPVEVPGLSPEMQTELEERIADFEENYLDSALNGGDGYVPRLKKRDAIIGITVNVIIALYYIWALVS